MHDRPLDSIRARMRRALVNAMKQRDDAATSALRSALAAIDNAEALRVGAAAPLADGPIAGAVSGVGAAEANRREVTEEEMVQIVRGEIASRLAAAAEYEQLGEDAQAARLRAEAAVLAPLTGPADGDLQELSP